jgi:hypothetical protein
MYALCQPSWHLHPHNHNDFDNISIWLRIIYHESLEVWFGILVLDHCVIELCPHDMLHFFVFRLHVTNNNGHNFAINQIIYRASHYCPICDTLDMFKHDLIFFQISPKLHSCNKAHSIPNPINQHFENENTNFLWKTTFLDVIIILMDFNSRMLST